MNAATAPRSHSTAGHEPGQVPPDELAARIVGPAEPAAPLSAAERLFLEAWRRDCAAVQSRADREACRLLELRAWRESAPSWRTARERDQLVGQAGDRCAPTLTATTTCW